MVAYSERVVARPVDCPVAAVAVTAFDKAFSVVQVSGFAAVAAGPAVEAADYITVLAYEAVAFAVLTWRFETELMFCPAVG